MSLENKDKLSKMELVRGADYISWLESFTVNYPVFFECDWKDYDNSILSNLDKVNLKKLQTFYSVIDDYAKENYLEAVNNSYSSGYFSQYHGIGYEIGKFYGKDVSVYCNRLGNVDIKDFIDVCDIIYYKKQEHTDEISLKLVGLSKYVRNLASEGIPLRAISDTFNSTMENLDEERKENAIRRRFSKKLVK